jgi:hypothetical protein
MRALLFFLSLMAWTQHLKAELTRPPRPSIPLMETIRRTAEAVMAVRGSGCTEAVYQKSMEVEFYNRGIAFLSQVKILQSVLY